MKKPAGGRPAAAAGILTLVWSLALGSVVLVLASDSSFTAVPWHADPAFYAFHVIVALSSAAAAAVILARANHAVGWISAVIGLCFAASSIALAWSLLAGPHSALPGTGFAAHAAVWLSGPGGFLAISVLPWFLRPQRPRGAALVMAGIGAVSSCGITLATATIQQDGTPTNPLTPDGTSGAGALEWLLWPSVWICAGVGLLAAADVVRRWRREPADSARAFGALALGVVLLFVASTVLPFWPADLGYDVVEPLALPLLFVAQLLVSLSAVVVALQTWDRGLGGMVPQVAVWGLLSSVVVTLYVAAVTVVSRLLPMSDEVARTVVVALLALLIHPLRQWLQERVDLLVHGGAADPVGLLAQLGRHLRDAEQQEGLPALVESLRAGLRLGWVEVAAVTQPAVREAAGHHRPGAAAQRSASFPLVIDRRHVGDLRVQAGPGQMLDERIVKAVTHLADVVALSLDLTQTNLRLRAASERLGEVRLEERRMLRRELHDGLGPALAGVALGLAAAQRRLHRDLPGAALLLEELRLEVVRRTEDLRLLARSLLPAQLDDGDLGAALDVLAQRFEGAGLQVHTRVDDTCGIDTQHQIAIYHVAAEALLNAYRHARASQVDIVVRLPEQGGTVLEVIDDGRGIGAQPQRGIGLRTMRERAAELGGRVAVADRPDVAGTSVLMVLP